jgi:S-adenosylmethionine:tRNA ribosyltransferase-isomerase
MKTSLFDFDLPETLIATHPASPREAARMLVVGEGMQDRHIRDLLQFLKPGDVMVFNDTRVIPARLFGKRDAASVEILLHKRLPSSSEAEQSWQCFAKPAKRLRIGDRLDFAENFHASVTAKLPSGEVVLQWDMTSETLHAQLQQHGHMPLPPYIEKTRRADAGDQSDYQTVYARHAGSVAAPTAGLHFTESMLAAIDAMGVKRVHLTLHVGGGTFLPVKTDDTADHLMHSEYAVLTAQAAQAINNAKAQGGRVIAVGTTSVRTLESAADGQGQLHAFAGDTAIFITPGYRFKIVDAMLTNFHLPCSTLFMLVSAFSGMERMQAAYRHAIASCYRFYSYGDACLLMRQAT